VEGSNQDYQARYSHNHPCFSEENETGIPFGYYHNLVRVWVLIQICL